MSFLDRYEVTQNAELRNKVKMAAIKAANDLLADPSKEAEYPFCYLVIREPENPYWLNQLMFSVVTNEQIIPESPDNDIQYQVNGVFSKHALANKNV